MALTQLVAVVAQNFGPPNPKYSLQVTYGKTGVGYTAAECAVTIPHFQIRCVCACVWCVCVVIVIRGAVAVQLCCCWWL